MQIAKTWTKFASIIYFVFYICSIQGLNNPQPGSNIWSMAAAIGTALNQLPQNLAADFNGTYTALQAIENKEYTISSKIDPLQTLIDTDFAGTFTAVQSIQNTVCTINSTIDVLDSTIITGFANVFSDIANITNISCQCAPILLSVSSTGTTLSIAGVYCLNSDVTLDSGADIRITGSNIVLNLSEHTVSNGSGIAIENDHVTIKNGAVNNVTGLTDAGITATSTNQIITIKDLNITNCTYGINMLDATNVFIENVKVAECTSAGINLNGTMNYLLDGCQVFNQSVPGFVLTSITAITVKNCSSSNTSIGFQATNDACIIFDSCSAFANANQGFLINGTTVSNQEACIFNCIVENSGTNGFDILEGASGTPMYYLQNCAVVATTAANIGFNLQRPNGALIGCDVQGTGTGFSIGTSGNISLLKSCCSSNNNGAGFLVTNAQSATISECKATNNTQAGFDLSAYVTSEGFKSVVEKCTATGNGTGFAGPATNDVIFVLNNAVNNTTNFSIFAQPSDPTGLSAPESLLTSTSRLYGDNLKNI